MLCRRLPLLALSAAIVLAGVGCWLVWTRTAITTENAAKIRNGMTRAEVEQILGGPPRAEGGWPPIVIMGPKAECWSTPHLLIRVWFFHQDNGRVSMVQVDQADDDLAEILLGWLRW
jgi:hypothetical protein